MTSTTIGPIRFTWHPDGEDPDTGLITLHTRYGYRAATPTGVARSEWDDFTQAAKGGSSHPHPTPNTPRCLSARKT